jgi:hypothetical protein
MTAHLHENEILSVQSIEGVPALLKYSLLQVRNRLGGWDGDVKKDIVAFNVTPELDVR